MNSKKTLNFTKKHVKFLLLGIAFLILFYILLGMKTGSESTNEILNLYVAPVGLVFSYAFIAWSILKKEKTI